MDQLQKGLLSFGIIIVAAGLVYVLFAWFNKSRRKHKVTKMLSMNLIIKYKPFTEYVNYQKSNNEKFNLFALKINNLQRLETKFASHIIKSYLTMIAKELSVYVPFGGKVAQTNMRDTFIIYYPETTENPYDVGERFKTLAYKVFHRNGAHISTTNSVAFISHEDSSIGHLLNALANSVRNLGVVTTYDEHGMPNGNDFMNLGKQVGENNYQLNSFYVEKKNQPNHPELYNELFVNGLKVLNYLEKLPQYEQAWVNMYLAEYVLSTLYEQNILNQLSLPFLLKTVEYDMFNVYLERLVIGNHFSMDHMILSLKITHINDEDTIIKNLLTLSNLGVKLSLDLNDINPAIYSVLQKYNINRVEITDSLMNHPQIAELLYYTKVNHIEVLYKTNKPNESVDNAHISHITTKRLEIKEQKKRGHK